MDVVSKKEMDSAHVASKAYEKVKEEVPISFFDKSMERDFKAGFLLGYQCGVINARP